MSGYYYDHRVESWESYLVQQSKLNSQRQGMEQAAGDICEGISEQSQKLLGGLESMTEALTFSMQAGLNGLGQELAAELSCGFGHVASVLNQGFSGLLHKQEEIKEELKRLVGLVELEEQRKAMENFRYAVFAMNRGLWDEALDYVTAAIEGDVHSKGYRLDWHFHWMKGELLLGTPARAEWPRLSPEMAEQSFLSAARYAKSDAPKEAAKALLMASVSAYAQSNVDGVSVESKLVAMRQHAEAAFALDPGLTEAAFQLAKAHMALGSPEQALPVLRKAIDGDATFAIRAADDSDCRRYEDPLNGFFAALQREKVREVRVKAAEAAATLEPYVARSESFAASPPVVRLRSVAQGAAAEWGLVDLLQYGATGLQNDLADANADLKRRKSTIVLQLQRVTQRRPVPVQVEEPVEVQEQYWEEVEVKPGGWFRKPVVDFIERTRTVTQLRKVTRMVERELVSEQLIALDGFEEVRRSGPAPEMKTIRPGRFQREGHTVSLTRAFQLGVTPVTQAAYELVMGENPSQFKGKLNPVEQVSWFDAVRFCNVLSDVCGLEKAYLIKGKKDEPDVKWKGLDCVGFRLPTEAEWEYACRAGTEGERYGPVDDVAWYDKNSGNTTHPVGGKKPNAWGLHDTLGNVWEWCWDWYGDYPSQEVSNPTGPSGGSYRAGRGGSWGSSAANAAAAGRFLWNPGDRYGYLGFRLARSLP